MGHYSELHVGNIVNSWKYEIPAFLWLLFEESEFQVDFDYVDHGDADVSSAGFVTTKQRAKARLDALGYSVKYVSEFVGRFHKDLDSAVEYWIESGDLPTINSDEDQSSEESAHSFIQMLKDGTKSRSVPRSARASHRTHAFRMFGEHLVPDFEALQLHQADIALRYGVGAARWAAFFDEDFEKDYPDVQGLIWCRICLELVDDSDAIRLELSDILDPDMNGSVEESWEREARDAMSDGVKELASKINTNLYFFDPLIEKSGTVQLRALKQRIGLATERLDGIEDSNQKGQLLEDLISQLISASAGLNVQSKRLKLEDQELDIVVTNNVNEPFWISLQSPVVLIECKNWSKKAGAPEARDFLSKIEDHTGLSRLGIFVSTNGFTSGFSDVLKRKGMASYTMAKIDQTDLVNFSRSDASVEEWLTDLIVKLV